MLFSSDEETDHEPKIILTAVSDGNSSDEGTEPASRCESDNSGKPNLDSLNDEDTTILHSESTNLTKHDYDNANCTGNSDCGSGVEEDVNDDIVRNSHDCTKDDNSDDSMMDSLHFNKDDDEVVQAVAAHFWDARTYQYTNGIAIAKGSFRPLCVNATEQPVALEWHHEI